jgi:hypothetical protein
VTTFNSTMTKPTDWRALCAELHAAVQLYTGQNPAAAEIPSNELVRRLMDVMATTAAALAQPEPEGLTDEEIRSLRREHQWPIVDALLFPIARAIQRRSARLTIQPVSVAERLPGPEDCDEEGWCWWIEYDGFAWELDDFDTKYSHWLPHHALPIPGPTP